ncbi:MAG: prevent-host-death family protein [Acidobacteria bacterium]|nr:prevent-host-death family protein [Acidobacteriota bacterium]
MCYMRALLKSEVEVGVRELRQNLSVYLARLTEGTVYRVTDRGHAVALLIPLPTASTSVERLVATGRAEPAKRDLLSLGRPHGKVSGALSKALRDVREDRL